MAFKTVLELNQLYEWKVMTKSGSVPQDFLPSIYMIPTDGGLKVKGQLLIVDHSGTRRAFFRVDVTECFPPELREVLPNGQAHLGIGIDNVKSVHFERLIAGRYFRFVYYDNKLTCQVCTRWGSGVALLPLVIYNQPQEG